jgi:hypothetical protein
MLIRKSSCLRRRARAVGLFTTVLLGSTLASGETAITTVQALAATPFLYANRPVTVTGRFRGRQPSRGQDASGIARGRWDFLLQADDAAVWVSGIRPAGWDFDLDPRSPADASRGPWLEVTGTFRVDRRRGLHDTWIEATDLRRAGLSSDRSILVQPGSVAPALVFQDPIPGEQDVPRDTAVRLQFSRAILPETLSEHIQVSYAAPRPIGAPPIPRFTARYAQETRSITLSFVEPLAPLAAVKIELLAGIAGTNGLPVAPAGYTFTTAR